MIYTLLTTLHMKYNLTLPEIIMAYTCIEQDIW